MASACQSKVNIAWAGQTSYLKITRGPQRVFWFAIAGCFSIQYKTKTNDRFGLIQSHEKKIRIPRVYECGYTLDKLSSKVDDYSKTIYRNNCHPFLRVTVCRENPSQTNSFSTVSNSKLMLRILRTTRRVKRIKLDGNRLGWQTHPRQE